MLEMCSAMQVAKHGEIADLKTTEGEGRTAPVWTDRWALVGMKLIWVRGSFNHLNLVLFHR